MAPVASRNFKANGAENAGKEAADEVCSQESDGRKGVNATSLQLTPPQKLDHSLKISNLELRKHSLYLNFINDLNSSLLSVGEQETKELIQKYTDTFSEIQGNFLKLYNKEMKHFANIQKQHHHRVTSNPEQKTAKNYINHDIVKNMIEILNNQIFLKMLNHLITRVQQVTPPETADDTKLKNISPINLKIFKQLIPLSYHQSIREKLIKMNEDELNHQVSKSNSSLEDSPDEAKLQQISLMKLDTVEDLDGEGSQQLLEDLNSGLKVHKVPNGPTPASKQTQNGLDLEMKPEEDQE